MSIVQTLAGAIASSGSYTPPPTPTYELTAAANNVDEGASLTFTANTTLVPDGTTLYWACTNTWGGGSLRFVPGIMGEFIINSNTGSFSITISADNTTAGGEQRYSVFLYSTGYPDGQGSGGLTEGKVENILVNDTSLTPVAPFSLNFPAGNPYVLVSNTQTDWNLGTTYTIEYWSKQNNASANPRPILTVMSQGPDSGQIDMGYMYEQLLWNGSQSLTPEPTPGTWTHVAWVRESGSGNITLYYNGVNQTTFSAGPALANGGSDLYIGRRAGINGQGFYGKLAMIRVSTTAKYLDNFSPSLTYGVEADTQLMLGSDNPLTDLSYYELNGVVPSNQNGNNLYFSKATYPNLNTQIQAGNTVTDTLNFGFTSTVVAVTSADPDNWGVNVSPSLPYVTPVNFSGAGRHHISNGGAVVSGDFPSYQSLQFVNSQNDYLELAGSSDWNLGTTWTIEFWLNADAASDTASGGIWGLLNQVGWSTTNAIVVALSDNKLVFLSRAWNANDDVRYTEPTPGRWTHVAISNDAGTQKVFYNGAEQTRVSGNVGSAEYTNGSNPLRIGRLGPQNGGTLNGKMAMVRISDSAKYLTAFTATTTYGVDANTRLFLGKVNPLVDSKAHSITNNGVTTSTGFPQSFTGHHNPYSGGNLGATYSLFGDPNITAFSAIPVGARITSNLSGFGIRLVTGNGPVGVGQQISYDNTGLPGGTVSTTSDTYNFYW